MTAPAGRALLVTRPGRDLGLGPVGPVEVECEDGTLRQVDGTLPDDFPLGYHRLRTLDGDERRLIVSPGRCWLPDGLREWGWAVQVYALRSAGSWGIGDLADLRAVREWAQSVGAGFLLVNPLHAAAPTLPQEDSPYLPVSRRFLNPIYLRVDEVPGAERVDLAPYEARGRALDAADEIDRDAVWQLKRTALRAVFDVGMSDEAERWCLGRGEALQGFATWCAVAELHGPDWRDWPDDLQRPDAAGVARFVAEHADEVRFHGWLQWALDAQLRRAIGEMTVLQDLPVGVDGGGADAWLWQDVLADGVLIGAPPDAFNAGGQVWGSPPLDPSRLQLAGYEPFVQSVRATIGGSGGIRIDHVMGLFRLWWVPDGESPAKGAYVRYPSDDLLDIVALESHRARAIVVGEDLSTVEAGVREELADRQVLSYKLLWFEHTDPASWPAQSLAAVTTHDLPTVTGVWTGDDPVDEFRDRLVAGAGLDRSAPVEEAVGAAYSLLARAPSMLLTATLEHAVGARLRPNVPGTKNSANWCRRLPVAVEDLPTCPGANVIASELGVAVRGEVRRRRPAR